MPKPLREQITLAEAATSSDTSTGVLEVEFITPGWGSSGYYSREVVEAAAPLFTVGTHMYFDHPTDSEAHDRPERSVRDLAAVVVEAGTVSEETGGVRGKVKPLAPYRELLTDEAFATNVGLSIRGSATDIVEGEAEGRRGPIIEGLADIASVDFVTRAGRGGRVLQVLESAQAAERAIARGVAEATADERREQLSDTVRSTHGSSDRWVWVRDFDDTTVWFEISADDEASKTWQQEYTVADDDQSVTLTGDRTEVRAVTRYVPATRPDDTTTTEETQEVTMGTIQVEEAEHRRLTEAAGRVETLESERDTAVQERDEARGELAGIRRTARARELLSERAAEANVAFTPLEERGLMANVPTSEDGTLDEAAFTRSVDEAATTVRESRGEGQVRGFGGTTVTTSSSDADVSESDIDTAVAGAFGRTTQVKEA